jgi:uncharacterized OsmC-like protein
VNGILRITAIRIRYRFKIPEESAREKAERALSVYADGCPAYQTVKDCIRITWEAKIENAAF